MQVQSIKPGIARRHIVSSKAQEALAHVIALPAVTNDGLGPFCVFTIYWFGGNKSTIIGRTFEEAYNEAGFTHTARNCVEMYRYGTCDQFSWDNTKKAWIAK